MDFVTLWGLVSKFLTGAFGVLGLLKEYKDKTTGKLTKWGLISLSGICLSVIGGVAADLVKANSDAMARKKSALEATQLRKAADDAVAKLTRMETPTEGMQIEIIFVFQCDADFKKGVCESNGHFNSLRPSRIPGQDPNLSIHVRIEGQRSDEDPPAIALFVETKKNRMHCYQGPPPVGPANEHVYEYCSMIMKDVPIYAARKMTSLLDFEGANLYISDAISAPEMNWAKYVFSITFKSKSGQFAGAARPDLQILPDQPSSPASAVYTFPQGASPLKDYIPNMGQGSQGS